MTSIYPHKQQLMNQLGDYQDKTILDYGCGWGDFVELIIKAKKTPKLIIAADSNKDMLEKIHNRFPDETNGGLVRAELASLPSALGQYKFDKIICHNVLECVDDKIEFINSFQKLMNKSAILILSHHDFDSCIYNSTYKSLSRNLIHHFADTQQGWQKFSDGQMGRKIPGLISRSVFKATSNCETWRITENEFKEESYGYLMGSMIKEVAGNVFDSDEIQTWYDDLTHMSESGDYYFSIDLVVAKCEI